MNKASYFFLFIALNYFQCAFPQSVTQDATLDVTAGPGTTEVRCSAIQSDGKIIVGGNFTNYNGTSKAYICRLNIDGSVDTGFTAGFTGSVYAIIVQSDGKILVGGGFGAYVGTTITTKSYICRLNSDGSLDTGFNTSGTTTGFDQQVYGLCLQTDGKILVGGVFTSYNGTNRNYICRLNSDGTIDSSFNPGAGFKGTTQSSGSSFGNIRSIALQSDGKIICGGQFGSFNGTTINGVARLNSNGTLDTGFSTGTGFLQTSTFNGVTTFFDQTIYSVVVQSNGNILIGGSLNTFNGNTVSNLCRLSSTGILDAAFTTNLVSVGSVVYSLKIQSDNKIVFGGSFSSVSGNTLGRVARINSDGTLDTAFIPTVGCRGSSSLFPAVYDLQIQSSDSKIILAGSFEVYNNVIRLGLVRINTDSSLDTGFSTGTGFYNSSNGINQCIARQTDGKLIVGGAFSTYRGAIKYGITRLNIDGTTDAGFNQLTTGLDGSVSKVAVQSDGKIVVAGNFNFFNGTSRNYICRLNSDGSLDTGFSPGTGFSFSTTSLIIQSDGKIIVGGFFNTYNGTTRNYICRLNTDGSLDTGFNTTGAGFNSSIYNLAIQTDGKIIAIGFFTSYNGTARNYICRLNSDGSLDTGFNPGTGFSSALSIIYDNLKLQTDGKIVIGGSFSSYNGVVRQNICRINADGSLDSTFDPLTAISGTINTIAIQDDGYIIVAGSFSANGATTNTGIARLSPTGTFDSGFNPGTGFGFAGVNQMLLRTSGKIVVLEVVGNFSGFNTTTSGTTTTGSNKGLARLNVLLAQTVTLGTLPTGKIDTDAPFALSASSTSGLTAFTYSSANTSVATISGSTVTILKAGTTDITATQAGDSNYNPATSAPLTLTIGLTLPVAPTNLTATVSQTETGKIILIWTNNGTNAANIELQKAPITTKVYGASKKLAPSLTTFSDTVTVGIGYYYRIRTSNSLGVSAWSNEVGAATFTNLSSGITAINDPEAYTTEFLLYPNPVIDQLNLTLHTDLNGQVKVSIFDSEGKIVVEKHLRKNEPLLLVTLEKILPSSGLYFVQCKIGDKTYTGKIIKE